MNEDEEERMFKKLLAIGAKVVAGNEIILRNQSLILKQLCKMSDEEAEEIFNKQLEIVNENADAYFDSMAIWFKFKSKSR